MHIKLKLQENLELKILFEILASNKNKTWITQEIVDTDESLNFIGKNICMFANVTTKTSS